MKNFFCISFLFFCLLSCSKQYLFNRDANSIAKKLYQLKELDQAVRNQDGYFEYYFGVNKFNYLLDSLTWSGNETSLDSLIANTKVIFSTSKHLTGKKKEDYLITKNRNELLTSFVDSLSVEELIKISKKYGFPSHERLAEQLGGNADKRLTSSPHLIFVHAPERFIPKVRKLVIKEYLKGRIDKNACSHIFWHLNGRKGNPFPEDYGHCKVDTLR